MYEDKKILIVEDNENIIEGLEYILQKEGFNTCFATTKREAFSYIDKEQFDLFLIDVQLPDGNGFEICKYVKQNLDLPVILTSAIGEEANVVYGLDLGAEDFIVKPFRNNELIARINCVLRRNKNNKDIIIYRNIRVNLQKAKVYNTQNEEIFFTSLEYKLLLLLLNNRNKLVTRGEILDKIWDTNEDYVNDNTVSVYIKRLRKKLGSENDDNPIETIRGIGYILND